MNRNQKLATNFTYIKIENEHNYLALVIDAYSKQIIGNKLDNQVRTSFCTDVFSMAIKNRKYLGKYLINYSDRGFQYFNPKYTTFTESNSIKMSMTEQ